MIELDLRGTDSKTDDEERICVVCYKNEPVVMSTCCLKVNTCMACAHVLYDNKVVGEVTCMNCRKNVTRVYRILL